MRQLGNINVEAVDDAIIERGKGKHWSMQGVPLSTYRVLEVEGRRLGSPWEAKPCFVPVKLVSYSLALSNFSLSHVRANSRNGQIKTDNSRVRSRLSPNLHIRLRRRNQSELRFDHSFDDHAYFNFFDRFLGISRINKLSMESRLLELDSKLVLNLFSPPRFSDKKLFNAL